MKGKNKTSFGEIFEASRAEAAHSAWNRARMASCLRHSARAHGNGKTARRFAEMKLRAVQAAAWIDPEGVKISIDAVHQIGLTSVQFKGCGRLHLPADAKIRKPR